MNWVLLLFALGGLSAALALRRASFHTHRTLGTSAHTMPRLPSSNLYLSRESMETARRFGGSGVNRFGKAQMDPSQKLRFKKTIKIDTDSKVPLTDMKLSAKTREVLESKGFEHMTPVQAQSFDPVYSGEDVVARSRTGTGKTFAFGLPLIEKAIAAGGLGQSSPARYGAAAPAPLILILEPTRELALQVAQELGSVCAAHRMRVQAIYGGAPFASQIQSMRDGVHILVSTPGRLLDHISRGTLDLGSVRHVVLDEGDTMLEMGFQKAVESIIMNVKSPGEKSRKAAASALEESYDQDYPSRVDDTEVVPKGQQRKGSDVQMLLFSATMPGWICQLTDKHMTDPVFLDAVQEGETRLADTITHYAVRLPNLANRMEAVTSYVEDLILTRGAGGQTIVFTNTKEEADNLVGSNCFGQLKSAVLHGDIGQNSRQATIRQFKQGAVDILVATDVAARGLDIAGVDLVVHTAPPHDPDTYVHRAGRTGRAGRSGSSIVLYAAREERRLREFEGALKFQFQKIGPPTQRDICEASANYAVKKLQSIKPQVAAQFLPHARALLSGFASSTARPLFPAQGIDAVAVGMDTEDATVDAAMSAVEGGTTTSAEVESFVAKCLAAISNRNSATSRSLLTGQAGSTTMQVEATFRAGEPAPETIRDWQRLLAGVLKRSLGMEDVVFGKMALGRAGRHTVALIDLDTETAEAVLARITGGAGGDGGDADVGEAGNSRVALPAGFKIAACDKLPDLIEDQGAPRTYRGGGGGAGGAGGGRGGAGTYGRARGVSYSGGREAGGGRGRGGSAGAGDGSGRSWARKGDMPRTGGGGGGGPWRDR